MSDEKIWASDDYRPGERIVSRLTNRKGVVMAWPEGRAYPLGHGDLWGAIWVRWDDTGHEAHAWRHQVRRL